ncbi:MAG: OmpA family protein [Flavobacteriales bacterium]|nr:OmpA family protein [Flavobacteriales bacterium]
MKNIKIISVFALVMLFSMAANAQKNYKTEADVAFSGGKYYLAIEMYKKAYTKETKGEVKSEILYKIGECYNNKNDGKQAAVWYNKAIKAKYDDPIAIFKVAEIYRSEGKYEEAMAEYKKYKAANPSDKRADMGIKSCEMAKEWKDNPTRFVVNPMPLLNSEDYDFSPVFSDRKNEEIYFTSTRQGSAGEAVSDVTGMNFSDLYVSKRDKKGKWSEPVVLNETVNSPASEGASCLNEKRNVIYFTRCGVEKKGIMGCQLMMAKKAGQNWGDAEVITVTEDTFTVGHPAISPDDNTLVFASNMPGGQGGKDLWYITYDKKAKTWSEPTNLGSQINTPGDEMFPFIRDNGELYFASNGHEGMGGLDIFKAASTGVNQWSGVENLQSPLNSEAHDFGIVFEPGKDRGFFTTSREGGKGGDDIWEFYLPPKLFSLEGVVKDLETGNVLANALIKLVGTDGSSAEATTDANGNFAFVENGPDARYINENTSYSLVVTREGYLVAKGKETTVGLDASKKFFHEYALQPFKDVVIKLPLIEYEYNKADLKPNSKDSLDYLYNIMVENPTIIIQLRSHTDFRGSATYNQKLSQRRAQSCVDYLTKEKGIHPDRIVAKGMGESEPIKGPGGVLLDEKYINALKSNEEKEAAHQRNRRTDFKVIGDNFVPPATEGTEPTPEEGSN